MTCTDVEKRGERGEINQIYFFLKNRRKNNALGRCSNCFFSLTIFKVNFKYTSEILKISFPFMHYENLHADFIYNLLTAVIFNIIIIYNIMNSDSLKIKPSSKSRFS